MKKKVEKVEKVDSTNPFNIGVNYEMFLSNVDSKNTVESLLEKHKISKEDIEFIKRELKIIKK